MALRFLRATVVSNLPQKQRFSRNFKVGQNQLWAAFEELSCEMFSWEEPDLTLRQLDSVVPAGFHSGDFSSQEQIRIEN